MSRSLRRSTSIACPSPDRLTLCALVGCKRLCRSRRSWVSADARIPAPLSRLYGWIQLLGAWPRGSALDDTLASPTNVVSACECVSCASEDQGSGWRSHGQRHGLRSRSCPQFDRDLACPSPFRRVPFRVVSRKQKGVPGPGWCAEANLVCHRCSFSSNGISITVCNRRRRQEVARVRSARLACSESRLCERSVQRFSCGLSGDLRAPSRGIGFRMTTHFTGCAPAATDSERPCVDLRSRGDTASTVFSGARVGAILVDSPEAAG